MNDALAAPPAGGPPPRPDLARLAARLPPNPLTRFAPSPTGHLHLGHLVNAVYVWGLARALGGRVLLRIEDHDRVRSRREYESAILDDLEWLGLVPDIGAIEAFRGGSHPLRQSDAGERYDGALRRLRERAHVFACDCSRKEIAAAVGSARHRETPYPGRCRHRGLDDQPGRGLRVHLPPSVVTFVDGRLGLRAHDPSRQCGDLLLRDRDGHWTYQFAVVVDDTAQEIDLVVRGEDLLDSTGRQVQLARMLGRDDPPVFVHHGLVRHAHGDKLSKSNRDTSLRELRALGRSAADLLGHAAWLCGLVEAPRPIDAAHLASLFVQP
jgi:glutamyl/glutaminyl-tRNA synthetase